ncbi:DUF3265 domain-containing protein [Vibrio parahaemolyticus]|nr:DUF3265 domain-containing protein [Vibrio parahaemolyticus]MCG0009736.1 DUF3265 domain-containing protein [Vibrio parahaemolyticus]
MSLVQLKWVKTALNKAFKRDLARVAFLLCVDFSDLGGVRKHGIALLPPPFNMALAFESNRQM